MIAMGKKIFMAAITMSLFLLASLLIELQVFELANANPYNFPYKIAQFSPSPQWVFVKNITGNHSQDVDIHMPNLSHWRVGGMVLSYPGTSGMKISYDSQFTSKNRSGYNTTNSWWIGLEHTNATEKGQGIIQIRITASNIENYLLTVEYYNPSAIVATDNPTMMPSLSASKSPSPLASASSAISSLSPPTQQPITSPSAPEFPSWLILPLLMMAAALGAVLFRKRVRSKLC
jgi:hypothetical protein